jgi:hypothetical protein
VASRPKVDQMAAPVSEIMDGSPYSDVGVLICDLLC